MKPEYRNVVTLAVLALMLLALPPIGLLLAGFPLARYAEFPPRTLYVFPAPFSTTAFAVFAFFIAGCCIPLVVQVFKTSNAPHTARRTPAKSFPWWGWSALIAGMGCWTVAWTRFEALAAVQPHTFLPLWISYIIVVNALDYQRSGMSMLTHQTGYFLALFPASSMFWWVFEYLNRFVQNWRYEVVEYPPLVYFGYATLSFATVLPAVMGTRRLLLQSRWLQRSFHRFWSVRIDHPQLTAGCALLLAAVGLMGIGVWPDILFPLLWVAPVLILSATQRLLGISNLFSPIASGDWRPLVSSALAALVCGFFWEMWNYGSMSRWVYRIPLVDRYRLFEMPLLGYAGYLPFGLTCAAVAHMVKTFTDGHHRFG